jgi:Ion channel
MNEILERKIYKIATIGSLLFGSILWEYMFYRTGNESRLPITIFIVFWQIASFNMLYIATTNFFTLSKVNKQNIPLKVSFLFKNINDMNIYFLYFLCYVVIILFFGNLYFLIGVWSNNAYCLVTSERMDMLNSIYFSTITAGTVGYGDIYPLKNIVKIIVCIEIVVSYTFTLIILSKLVSSNITD